MLLFAAAAAAAAQPGPAPSTTAQLFATTQGPLWPPSEITNEEGDFFVVGIGLFPHPLFPGFGFPVFDQALLVSKNTLPPHDAQGRKINTNIFASHYTVIRPLDLSPGSPDLDRVLYNLSFGPPDETGATRIPREGDSPFNLSISGHPCPELFPGDLQREIYTRPRFALHQVPVWGFQGDQVAYDNLTGESFVPVDRGGVDCPAGCLGEDPVDSRRSEPITLGEWLQAEGKVEITLADFDDQAGGYTAAVFDVKLKNMLPSSVYSLWTIRPRGVPGAVFRPKADPLAVPNVIVTDSQGKGRGTFKVIHPFPPRSGPGGLRIEGVVVAWHADQQNWGACPTRFGAGVDGATHLSSITTGILDFTDLITVAPSGDE